MSLLSDFPLGAQQCVLSVEQLENLGAHGSQHAQAVFSVSPLLSRTFACSFCLCLPHALPVPTWTQVPGQRLPAASSRCLVFLPTPSNLWCRLSSPFLAAEQAQVEPQQPLPPLLPSQQPLLPDPSSCLWP